MDVKTLKDFEILPPKPGVCALCGKDHELDHPHNLTSLYYQYRFYRKYGRFPTWSDAAAHLISVDREILKVILEELGYPYTDTENPIAEPYHKQE